MFAKVYLVSAESGSVWLFNNAIRCEIDSAFDSHLMKGEVIHVNLNAPERQSD